jgi:1,4-alpha-glucan branching enzyme
MGWMNDMLKYMKQDPVYRRWQQGLITFSLMYAFNENFLLPLSHDEVVHLKRSMLDKMPGDDWQKAANLRALYGYMWTHPGKKLLFMGQDFGQWHEWNEAVSLPWHLLESEFHQHIQAWVRDLNTLYNRDPALWQVDDSWQGFAWMDANDNENSVISFVRRAADPTDQLLVVCNFTPVVRHHYRVPAPQSGFYDEILNSDAAAYGGSNAGNLGGVEAVEDAWAPQGWALYLTLPPLATLILKPRPVPPPAVADEVAEPPTPVAVPPPTTPETPPAVAVVPETP